MTKRIQTQTDELAVVMDNVLQQKEQNLDRLKDIMQQMLKLNSVPTDLMRCHCLTCNGVFYILSNIGKVRCAYCGNLDITPEWGALRLVFEPER